MTTTTQTRKGGSWLLDETPASDVFTPEKLTDEHRLMAQTTQEFVDNELLPAIAKYKATVCFTAPTAYRAMLKLLRKVEAGDTVGGAEIRIEPAIVRALPTGIHVTTCTRAGSTWKKRPMVSAVMTRLATAGTSSSGSARTDVSKESTVS